MSISPPGIPPNIAAIAGPLLLGFMFDWACLAILLNQVYVYYVTFPNDSHFSKAIVYVLLVLGLAQTVLLTYDGFRMFAVGYGNPAELLTVGFIWLTVPVWSSVVSMIVQIFFAYRLYILSRSRLLGIFITCLSLTQGISGVVAGSEALSINDFSKIPKSAFKGTMVWLTGSAVCDVLIAGCMIYFLSSRDTGFTETHAIIRRLIRLTIETGTITAITATVTIILFAVFPFQTFYTTPSIIIAKLHAITAVVLFNNRAHFRNAREQAANEMVSSMAWARGGTTRSEIPRAHHQVQMPNGVNPTGSIAAMGGIRVDHEQWSDSAELAKLPAGSNEGHSPDADGDIKLPV